MMSTTSNQPDLIISLSRDKVKLHLSAQPDLGRAEWQASFVVDGLFLQDQISHSIDQALLSNPALIDHFPCVHVVMLDRPNINVPQYFTEKRTLAEIASRHLRLRAGDTLTTDTTDTDIVFCYTMPAFAIRLLREYYTNLTCTHLSSVLWNFLAKESDQSGSNTRLYLAPVGDALIVMAIENDKLVYSKNFIIRHQADLIYYSIACSRMLKSKEQWLVSIAGNPTSYEMPGDKILKIDHRLSLPDLPVLMSQFKPCES